MSREAVRREVQEKFDPYERKRFSFPALLGNGQGVIAVPDKPSWVYVRIGSDEIPGQAFNQRVPLRDNYPVIVGYTSEQPTLFQVLSLREVYADSGIDIAPQVVSHHKTHEFRNPEGGDDVTWIQGQQFVPLLCRPTSPASMIVTVYAVWYPWLAAWHQFEGGNSADLTAQIPAAGLARVVLISVDGDTEALQITAGATFSIFLPAPDIETQVPAAPAGSIPIAGIYLVNGQTEIDWDSIYDLRLFAQPVGGSVTPAPHDMLSTEHDDSDPAAAVQGAMIVGDATPEWARLVVGIARAILSVNAGGTDPEWVAFDWDSLAAAAGADMVHLHSAAGEGGQLDWDNVWSDAIHDHSAAGEGGEVPLASLGSYIQGSIMKGGAADWDALVAGGARFILMMNAAGTEPEWLAFDWDTLVLAAGADMVHLHSAAGEGGQLDWDNVWIDAVHDHSVAGEGGEIPLASLGGYTQGDIIYGGAADYQDLAVGAIGDVLTVNGAGTEPEWAAPGGLAHNLLSATHPDTDPQAVTRGSIIYGDATPDWTELVIGAAGRVLTVNAGGTEPEWAVGGGGGGRAGDDYYGLNLIKNSPGQIPVDGAEPQWWDDVANATITDEDTAGEAPPDIHERCFKVVTIANDVYGYQTFTLADEEVLDQGVTVVSFGCWVYCATGAKASIAIYGMNLTLQESAQAGAGAWEWLEVNNITLDVGDATIQVRLIVDTNTAWFTMPMFAVGPAAQPWVPRGNRYVPVNWVQVLNLVGTGDVALSDLDLTASSDPLAIGFSLAIVITEPNGTVGSFGFIAHNDVFGATAYCIQISINVINRYFRAQYGPVSGDDGQVVRYQVEEIDADNDITFTIRLTGYWMWE